MWWVGSFVKNKSSYICWGQSTPSQASPWGITQRKATVYKWGQHCIAKKKKLPKGYNKQTINQKKGRDKDWSDQRHHSHTLWSGLAFWGLVIWLKSENHNLVINCWMQHSMFGKQCKRFQTGSHLTRNHLNDFQPSDLQNNTFPG